MKHAIKRVHLVGIGGSGMLGIAEVLHNLGYYISGSDIHRSDALQRLQSLGITIYYDHLATHIVGVDVVVTSTAIQKDNIEVIAARQARIPVVSRAVMLAELMRFKQGIAIAGTHGKTTTTSLVASILAEAGLDPTFVIGGKLNSAGINARLGMGEHIVVEADESDASFLKLLPMMAVVTNIDQDHMSTYGHSFQHLKAAFIEFLHRMPFYGVGLLCIDDPAVVEILDKVERPIVTYGFSSQAQIRATALEAIGQQMHFLVDRSYPKGMLPLSVTLNTVGQHNVLNALAAIGIATELGLPDQAIQRALAHFKGVGRRFQYYGELALRPGGGSFALIDDYAHHPVEIRTTLQAARSAFPNRRLVLAFQPHRYTRTKDCFQEFIQVLKLADLVLLTEVYSAGEAPIAKADGDALVHTLRSTGDVPIHFVPDIIDMPLTIRGHVNPGDVVLCMGAGSIAQIADKVYQNLTQARV